MPNQNQTALPKFILWKPLNSRTLKSAKETENRCNVPDGKQRNQNPWLTIEWEPK